jgi:hypothetical protein
MMNQPALDSLARFCADQRQSFESNAWLNCSDADRRTIAIVAKYLSMTSWYGHEDELVNIAAEIDPEVSNDFGFDGEAKAIGFDLMHFSTTVRYRIALQRTGQSG